MQNLTQTQRPGPDARQTLPCGLTLYHATPADLDALTALEALCFPPAEAAGRQAIAARLQAFPNHFWLLRQGDTLLSFINGLVTDNPILQDALYEDAAAHNPKGAWQMIFGLDTHPDYRGHGYAALVMSRLIAQARDEGRKGCVLTCKQHLIHYYEGFGYQDEGVSASVHGGAVWHDMRLVL